MDVKEFITRRDALLEKLPLGSLAIVFSGFPVKSNADATYPFVVNSNFFYLTQLEQEHVALMLIKTEKLQTSYVFIDEIDESKTRWEGKKLDVETAKKLSGVPNVLTHAFFNIKLTEILSKPEEYGEITSIYVDEEKNTVIGANLATVPQFVAQFITPIFQGKIENLYPLIIACRMIKSPLEVKAIKDAIKATGYALTHLQKHLKPGIYEHQLEGLFAYAIKDYGNLSLAFDTIIASGKNAIVLHYPHPKDKIVEGVLVLCDLGAKVERYSGDITRTYPSSGVFNPLQKQIYEIVLGANEYIISLVKPGVTLLDLQKACVAYLAKACVKEGLIKDEEAIKDVYYHGVSHHLGLDTHDPIARDLPLVEGCVITVEPGLYFKDLGIGIRIEDDVLVTASGHENLSISIPKSIDALTKH